MALLSDVLGSAYLGTQGIIGGQGLQGTQGTPGAGGQGASGTQGAQGTQGGIGVQGIQGGLSPQGTQGSQGVQGLLGPQGSQGVQGSVGDDAGTPYIFDNGVTDSDPGNGRVKYNNATIGSVTQIFIDNLDNRANNQTAWYDNWDDSTSTTKGYLVFSSIAGSNVNTFRITGTVTVAAGYYKISVAYVSGSAVPGNTAAVSIIFSRNGDLGTQGAQGIQATQGSQGTQGGIGPQGAQGGQGIQGAQGIQGVQGNIGNTGGVPYTWTNATGNNDPGNGSIRYNNSTIASVTNIYIDNLDQLGNTQTAWYDTWDDSTSTVKGYLIFTSAATSGTTVNVFSITGAPTVNGGYYGIPVAYVSGSIPSNNAILSVTFARTGDLGTQGTQGAQGSQGRQGTQGGLAAQGSQGGQGIQATQGTQGGLAAQGAVGLQGSQGGQGIQATQGTQGGLAAQGGQGTQGLLGPQGVQGSLNTQGTVGTQGVSGSAGSSPNWHGIIYAAYGDCNPQTLLTRATNAGTVAPTPTNITTSVARIAYFTPPADITINKIRYYGVGTTTNLYRTAIYNGDTLSRLTSELAFTTAATTWGAAGSALNLTLTSGQLYFIAVSVNTTGTTAGCLAMSASVGATTGQIAVLPKSYPGSLDIDLSYLTSAFAQFAVTTGALPATAATIATQAAWTGGFPAFWLDSNNA